MKACVATGSYDLSVRVWDANSRDSIITVPHPEAQINCLSFIPNASGTSDVDHIAIGTWQKLKIFDISQSTQPVISPSFEGASKNITACGFSLPIVHGCWMFTGGEDGHVRIFDTKPVTQRQHVQTLTCHNALEIGSPITSVVLHLNQIELFIADQSGRVHIWDLSKQVNKSIYVPELSTFEFVVKLAVRPLVTQEGHTILSGITNRGKILTWQLSQIDYNVSPMAMDTTTEASFLGMARPTTQLNQERIGIGLTYTRDGRYLVASFADSEISWFPADNYPNYDTKEPIIFDIDCDWNWDTLVTVDSRYMFTGGSDGRLKYWDVENKKMITKIEGHQKGISALAISEH